MNDGSHVRFALGLRGLVTVDYNRLEYPNSKARHEQAKNILTDSCCLIAAKADAAVAVIDHAIGLWLSAKGLHAKFTLIDEMLLALFTGTLVLVIELSHQRDQDRLNQKLMTIELMNHHVRNALHVIVASAYVHGLEKQFNEIRGSVNRIDWAYERSFRPSVG